MPGQSELSVFKSACTEQTYPNPENMFHLEILGLRLAIQLHDFPKRGTVVLRVVGVNQHPSCTPPETHALGCGRLAFFPTGIYTNSD